MASLSIWLRFFNRTLPWPKWVVTIFRRFSWVIYCSQTTATRFWFGLASLSFAIFLYTSDTVHSDISEYVLMLKMAPDNVWAACFAIHGLSLWYGVFGRTYNKLLLMLEGILGTAIWAASAVAVTVTQGSFGGQGAGALIAFWLLVRYPTHWEQS